MALKQLVFLYLVCVLLITYGYAHSDSKEEAEAGQPIPGIVETGGSVDGSNSMADAYVDYISGGTKESDGSDAQLDTEMPGEGQEGNDEMTDHGEHEDSSTMDMLLRNFRGEYKGLKEAEIKEKLAKHIKEMDVDGDGSVSKVDLNIWLMKQGEKGAMTEDVDQLGRDIVDVDKDGKITWKEIEDDLKQYLNDGKDETQFQKDIKFEKLKFKHADKSGDKVLDSGEYARYLMPEYFSDMTDYSLEQYIGEFDQNDDMLITLDEFLKDLKDSLDKEAVTIETDRFVSMDTNKDGKLSKEEVRGIALEYTIMSLAKAEAKKLILTADDNKDGALSHDEIMKNHLAFTKGDTMDLDDMEQGRHDEL